MRFERHAGFGRIDRLEMTQAKKRRVSNLSGRALRELAFPVLDCHGQ